MGVSQLEDIQEAASALAPYSARTAQAGLVLRPGPLDPLIVRPVRLRVAHPPISRTAPPAAAPADGVEFGTAARLH